MSKDGLHRATRIGLAAALLASTSLLAAADGNRQRVQNGGVARTYAEVSLSNPLLAAFSLRFDNGDHKLRAIGITHGAKRRANAEFADKDNNDPMKMDVTFRQAPVAKSYSVTQKCRGTCTLAIKPGPGGKQWRLALRGFRLWRPSGQDSNVREIAVAPSGDMKSYKVTFKDNGTFDYTATVQYAWFKTSRPEVPTAYVRGRGTPRSSFPRVKMQPELDYPGLVLRGFSFQYRDGDHHVEGVGVTFGSAWMHDGDYGDNVSIGASYEPL